MTSGDIEPLRLLLLRYNCIKFRQLLRLKRMLPWRLYAYNKFITIVKFPRKDGIFPGKLLVDKSKDCNFLSFPNSKGILPDILLFHIFSLSMLIKFPIWVEIFPDMLLWYRDSLVRRVDRFPMHSDYSPPKLLLSIINKVK